ncbi:stretch-activated cation channel Mid1p [Monosporozyma servazzii]
MLYLCLWVFQLISLVSANGYAQFFDTDNSLKDLLIDSDNIISWEPIYANITPGGSDLYVFAIDKNAAGQGFAPSYEVLIFMSGNVCQYPLYLPDDSSMMESNVATNITKDIQLAMLFSFNESISSNTSLGTLQFFNSGYVESLAVSPIDIDYTEVDITDSSADVYNTTLKYPNLYVIIQLYNTTSGEPLKATPENKDLVWNYRLGISESDLIYQWDERSWLEVLDTDNNSALLMSGNVTSDSVDSQLNYTVYDPSLYDVYIYTQEEYNYLSQAQLTYSICAIKNGNYLTTSAVEEVTSHDLEESKLRVQKYIAASNNGMSEYFYVTGLNSSTTYVSVLVKKVGQSGNLTDVGGILFDTEEFTTKKDDTCTLIHGLDFCQGITYAVPSSTLAGANKTLLAQTYEYIATGLYNNFTQALQLIPCDIELDARYSPLRTCDDCAQSYKNWLCTVTIPRCTTDKSNHYIKRMKEESRNSFLNSYVSPVRDYFEILPCIDMCYHIVRDCPSDFGFACPSVTSNENLLLNSYNYYVENAKSPTCNMLYNN